MAPPETARASPGASTASVGGGAAVTALARAGTSGAAAVETARQQETAVGEFSCSAAHGEAMLALLADELNYKLTTSQLQVNYKLITI